MSTNVLWKIGATDFFFTFEEELHIERESSFLGHKGLGDLKDYEHRSLIVSDTTTSDYITIANEFKGRCLPFRKIPGWLHVVMTVDQDRGSAGGF